MRCSPSRSRPTSATSRGLRPCSSRTIASAISEVPPSTTTRLPAAASAPFAAPRHSPSRRDEIRAQDPVGVDLGALSVEAIELGIHAGQRVAPHAGVLAQVDAAAAAGHELVELVQRPAEARRRGRQVDRERPALERKRQRAPELRRRCA